MHVSRNPPHPLISIALLSFVVILLSPIAQAEPKSPPCRRAVLEGELTAGHSFIQPIGDGLSVYFQPIHSGWILRVIPSSGPPELHDYAELATPPYQSVTPLSLSTDFAFRAQDAIGWNPRRFRFATSPESFRRLEAAYLKLDQSGATPPAPLQVELSSLIAEAAEGTLTILDARLIPGNADQWRMAAAVASHFSTTAHTIVNDPSTSPTPLGKILWVRFRLDLDLPRPFTPNPKIKILPRICGTP